MTPEVWHAENLTPLFEWLRRQQRDVWGRSTPSAEREAREQNGGRRAYLFSVAASREVWSQLNSQARDDIEAAERSADGSADDSMSSRYVRAGAGTTRYDAGATPGRHPQSYKSSDPEYRRMLVTAAVVMGVTRSSADWSGVAGVYRDVCHLAVLALPDRDYPQSNRDRKASAPWRRMASRLGALFRDIYRPPFDPAPPFRPEWASPLAAGVAAAAYKSRRFDQLPVLADMLEESGCDDRPLLDHLRGPDAHARGCWALDAVLGKG